MHDNNFSVKILLIEDNPGDARLIKIMLYEGRTKRFRLDCSSTLQDGLKRISDSLYDIVLLDLSLPDSNGFDTFLTLYRRFPHIPIVILTSIDDETLGINSLREGAQDYLIKGEVDSNLLYRSILYAIERKNMEKNLLKIHKLESLSLIAGGIAHDFNNILNVILCNAELAKINSVPDDEFFESLSNIEKASFRARDLTRQLLTFSRGGAPLKKISSIGDLIKDTTSFILSGSNVKCDFFIPHNLWPVKIDPNQISQVINNLIINADQSMPDGGIISVGAENITIKPEGEDFTLRHGTYVKIYIKDHGCGIPTNILPKIFEPFFTTKPNGTGLGLAVSHSIIKKHEGLITVDSETDKGTNFYIYIPASPDELLPQKKEEKIFTGSGRILVMDDNEMLRNILKSILKRIGYEAEICKDVKEVISLYKQSRLSGQIFDAVIMDLTVPGTGGAREAIKELLDFHPSVKVIVSSGYPEDPVVVNFKDYGFKGIAIKPYKIKELSKVLYEVLNKDE